MNFIDTFHPGLVVRVLVVGMAVKVLGCGLAARVGGLRWAECWGVGWAMNARGELGIVLGLLAWQAGVIRERLFVALVTLAIVTTAMAGPMLKLLLRRDRVWSAAAALDGRLCLTDLEAVNAADAIRQLSAVAADRATLSPDWVAEQVLRREAMMSTAVGEGVALPHARLINLREPLVVVGLFRSGLDFNAPDALPVRLVFLILTPRADAGEQVRIVASIARLIHDPQIRGQAMAARSPTALLAALRIADVLHPPHAAAGSAPDAPSRPPDRRGVRGDRRPLGTGPLTTAPRTPLDRPSRGS